MKRPDQLTVSLGPENARHKANLKELALRLNLTGVRQNQDEGSISQLLIWLSRTYDEMPNALVRVLNYVGLSGGELDELDLIRPEWLDRF
jgi:hypothetical protein